MSRAAIAGAGSVAAAMGRLDRLGRVPSVLSRGDALARFDGRMLSALLVEDAVAGASLEVVLALVESASAPLGDELVARSRAVLDGGSSSPAPRDVAAPVGARVPRRVARASEGGRARSSRAMFAATGTAPGREVAPAAAHLDVASDAVVPGPLRALSRPARVGAATAIGLPPTVRPGSSAEDGTLRRAPGGPLETPAQASPRSPNAPAPGAVAGSSQAPAPAVIAGATAAVAPPAFARESGLRGEAAVGVGGGRDERAARPREPGSDPVAVAGLSGLVSWWDAREATRVPEGAAAPAVTGRSVTWSSADEPRPRDAGTADAALEASPLVRLSLRSALEELLLAEARASGIEVVP